VVLPRRAGGPALATLEVKALDALGAVLAALAGEASVQAGRALSALQEGAVGTVAQAATAGQHLRRCAAQARLGARPRASLARPVTRRARALRN